MSWASFCNRQACIEVEESGDRILLRVSGEPDIAISPTREEFAAFVDAARRGDLDHLTN